VDLKEKRVAALTAAQSIVDGAKAAERDPNAEENAKIQAFLDEVKDLDEKQKGIDNSLKLKALIGAGVQSGDPADPAVQEKARSLAEHFVKSGMFERLQKARGAGERFTVGAPEFKAATDPTLTTGITVPPQFGPVIQTKLRRLTISDLCAQGTLTSNALTYWTQGTVTGAPTPIAEGTLKPSVNFAFGQVTEALTKIAAVTKVSDEMTQDLDFLVSVIQSQLLQRLAIVEEDQLLNGNGTPPNLRGLLNRTGIQTYSTPATTTPKKTMDGIFHAMNLIRTNSFIEPDGIVMNPTDYENVRLGADGQAQYYGGGPFTGAYGNDGFTQQPGLWTLPTVITPAIAAGTVLVGGFGTSAQVFRKGGVRLESTNSNENDFLTNLVAMRVEERVALAVYYPTALCKVTITA
jgi:HK97 family phage major capsid protein